MDKKEYVGLHVWYTDDYFYDDGEYYGGFESYEEAKIKADELMANKEICNFDIYVK